MSDTALEKIFDRLRVDLSRDSLIQTTTDKLRAELNADRVVLYYFYYKWAGRVTFESLSHQRYTILGLAGPDECFNGEYAKLYEAGRVRSIADITIEPIAPCHRDFLQQIEVKANLVVPILTEHGLWGLLVAHACQSNQNWSAGEIAAMQVGAEKLATARSIRDN